MQLDSTEILVIMGGSALIAWVINYFFGRKEEGEEAMIEGEIQRATVVVDAAYVPSEIKLKVGVPAEVTFDRKDKGDCTEWVIFEKLPTKEGEEIKARLAEGKKTTVSFTPTSVGEYDFVCGMGMVHGKLVVSK